MEEKCFRDIKYYKKISCTRMLSGVFASFTDLQILWYDPFSVDIISKLAGYESPKASKNTNKIFFSSKFNRIFNGSPVIKITLYTVHVIHSLYLPQH